MPAPDALPMTATVPIKSTPRWFRIAQVVVGILLFGAVAFAAIRDWREVSQTVEELSWWSVAGCFVLALAGLLASVLTWRRLLEELGSLVARRPAGKIYLVGQLGKYLPGSVWAFVLQMELGRQVGVPRPRAFAASLVTVGINCVTSLALALLALSAVANGSWWIDVTVIMLVPIGLLAGCPPALTREVNLLLRLLRRPQLERPIGWNGVLSAAAWFLRMTRCSACRLRS